MLEEIVISAKKAIELAENSDNLQQVKVLYLGKSGFITLEKVMGEIALHLTTTPGVT